LLGCPPGRPHLPSVLQPHEAALPQVPATARESADAPGGREPHIGVPAAGDPQLWNPGPSVILPERSFLLSFIKMFSLFSTRELVYLKLSHHSWKPNHAVSKSLK